MKCLGALWHLGDWADLTNFGDFDDFGDFKDLRFGDFGIKVTFLLIGTQ